MFKLNTKKILMGNSETNPLENKKGKLEKKYFSKIII